MELKITSEMVERWRAQWAILRTNCLWQGLTNGKMRHHRVWWTRDSLALASPISKGGSVSCRHPSWKCQLPSCSWQAPANSRLSAPRPLGRKGLVGHPVLPLLDGHLLCVPAEDWSCLCFSTQSQMCMCVSKAAKRLLPRILCISNLFTNHQN